MSISERIDGLLEQHSLLKHPFYQAWSDGKLEMESLAGYSKEYYQLVKAVPEFMNPLIEMAPEGARVEPVWKNPSISCGRTLPDIDQ